MIYPSTTEILKLFGFYSDYPSVDPQRQQDIFDRGQLVHKACHWLALGKEPPWEEPHPELDGYLDGYRLFLKEHQFKLEYWERAYYCIALGFVSHPDQVGMLDGLPVIVEIKTGGYNDIPTRLQTAGQLIARGHIETGVYRYCLHLPGNGSYKLIPHTEKRDMNEFIVLVEAAHVALTYDLPLGRRLKQIMEERDRD